MVEIVTMLSEVYSDDGVVIWLTAPHAWFDGGSAIEACRTSEGRDQALRLVSIIADGAFA